MDENKTENNEKVKVRVKAKSVRKNTEGAKASGITYANVSNAGNHYFDDKIVSPRGHGFAAEQANHLADLYLGKDAQIVGDDNLKNGADRLVDGISIQSKYCASGSKCIQECFENGKFRYYNLDGSPMQIEVPSDMYDSAIQAMENRIKNGEINGVTDPQEAKNIVRKGHFTYQQAKNIAKAGTVESILFDAASGAIIARNTFGITAVLSFATSIWNGEPFDIAIKNAAANGLKVGGTAFISAVLAGQLGKAGLNSLLVGSSEAIVRIMGPKAAAVLVNAFRSGTKIYGAAAMKSAAKLLRGNVITNVASFVVLSIGDIANIFSGKISGAQLFKNLTNTASSVAGGGAGWAAGAWAGAAIGSVVPGIGTAIGGTIGGLIGAFGGGALASKASGAILDEFIEDDADKMITIIQSAFSDLAQEFLVSQTEAESIVDKLKEKLTGKLLKEMFASSDREKFARNLMSDYFENVASERNYIELPSNEEMQNGLKIILEEISDSENIDNDDIPADNEDVTIPKSKKYMGIPLDIVNRLSDEQSEFPKKRYIETNNFFVFEENENIVKFDKNTGCETVLTDIKNKYLSYKCGVNYEKNSFTYIEQWSSPTTIYQFDLNNNTECIVSDNLDTISDLNWIGHPHSSDQMFVSDEYIAFVPIRRFGMIRSKNVMFYNKKTNKYMPMKDGAGKKIETIDNFSLIGNYLIFYCDKEGYVDKNGISIHKKICISNMDKNELITTAITNKIENDCNDDYFTILNLKIKNNNMYISTRVGIDNTLYIYKADISDLQNITVTRCAKLSDFYTYEITTNKNYIIALTNDYDLYAFNIETEQLNKIASDCYHYYVEEGFFKDKRSKIGGRFEIVAQWVFYEHMRDEEIYRVNVEYPMTGSKI